MGFLECMETKNVCLDTHGRKNLYVTRNLKHPKNCTRGNARFGRFLRCSLVLRSLGQKCAALMRGRDGGSPRAHGEIRREKFAHLPPILPIFTPHCPKPCHHFPPFELSVSPDTKERDSFFSSRWTSAATVHPSTTGRHVVIFLRLVLLPDHCEYL
jgi:hypothetical protein